MKHRVHRTKFSTATHPIDLEIGRKIARRRAQLEMSLAALAAKLRISARRMHSLESGHISISASELVAIGAALGVSVFYFFDEKSAQSAQRQDSRVSALRTDSTERAQETEELLRAYNDIHDPESRRMLTKVVQKLAAGYGEEGEPEATTRKRRALSSSSGNGWLN